MLTVKMRSVIVTLLSCFTVGCYTSPVDPSSRSTVRNDTLISVWRASKTDTLNESTFFPPVRVGKNVYLADEKYLFCVDTASGETIWTTQFPTVEKALSPTMHVTNSGNILTLGLHRVGLYNAEDGTLIWEVRSEEQQSFMHRNSWRSMLGNRLYLIRQNSAVLYIDRYQISCLDVGTGSELWRSTISRKLQPLDSMYFPQSVFIFSISAGSDGVYIGINEPGRRETTGLFKTCSMNKLDGATGELVWRCLIPPLDSGVINKPAGVNVTELQTWGPVALCEDGGVIGVTGGCITKWDRKGEIEYRYYLSHEGQDGIGEGSRPSTYRDGVFYNTDNGFNHAFAYAFDTRTRTMLWQRSLRSNGSESIVFNYPNQLSSQYFETVTDNRWFFRINRYTGMIEHQSSLYRLPKQMGNTEHINSSMLIDGNSIYFGTESAWYKGMIP